MRQSLAWQRSTAHPIHQLPALGLVHLLTPTLSVTTTEFIHRGATGHTQEPPAQTSSTQNLPNMKRSSIRLVRVNPIPELIWLPKAVQRRTTRMPAPAPAAPNRRSVALGRQTLICIILAMALAAVAAVSFWKSHGSSHQLPPLLRTQNSNLPPNLPVDNVPPPRITIT